MYVLRQYWSYWSIKTSLGGKTTAWSSSVYKILHVALSFNTIFQWITQRPVLNTHTLFFFLSIFYSAQSVLSLLFLSLSQNPLCHSACHVIVFNRQNLSASNPVASERKTEKGYKVDPCMISSVTWFLFGCGTWTTWMAMSAAAPMCTLAYV